MKTPISTTTEHRSSQALRPRKRRAKPVPGAVPLLASQLSRRAQELEQEEPDPVWLVALGADALREGQLDPPALRVMQAGVAALDGPARRRFWLLAELGHDHPDTFLHKARSGRAAWEGWMLTGAKGYPLLTCARLGASLVRAEEFARHLLQLAGAEVAAESAQESRARLRRIDFARLLDEAEKAKEGAEAHLAAMEKKHLAELAARNRRSKF